MSHLQSFRVIRYRGLDGLDIPRVAPRVNLITGRNAAGKTSLLEAVRLFHGRFNSTLVWNSNVRRSSMVAVDPAMGLAADRIELEGEEYGRSCSFRLEYVPSANATVRDRVGQQDGPRAGNGSKEAALAAEQGRLRLWIDGKEADLSEGSDFHMTAKGPVLHPLVPMPAGRGQAVIEGGVQNPLVLDKDLIDHYSDAVRGGRKRQILDVLSVLDHGIADLEILTDETGFRVWATTADGSSSPLYDLGDGMVRLFRLAANLAGASQGVLLVDEIENGLHHSVLGEFWRRLHRMASAANVQIFAATHSHECIDEAITAFGDESEDLAVHGLYRARKTGRPEATFFSGDTLAAARDLNFELR